MVTALPGKTVNASAIHVSLAQTNLNAVVGAAYSYNFNQNLTVSGDPGYTGFGVKWALASGSLPAGLTLNPSTGVVSGTPSATGTSTFLLNVTYKTKVGEQSYQLPVSLAITLTMAQVSVPTGIVGVAYPGFDFKSALPL